MDITPPTDNCRSEGDENLADFHFCSFAENWGRSWWVNKDGYIWTKSLRWEQKWYSLRATQQQWASDESIFSIEKFVCSDTLSVQHFRNYPLAPNTVEIFLLESEFFFFLENTANDSSGFRHCFTFPGILKMRTLILPLHIPPPPHSIIIAHSQSSTASGNCSLALSLAFFSSTDVNLCK